MKNTLRIIILLVIAATFGSCTKDAEHLQHLDSGINHLYFINSRVSMTCNFVPPFEDQYDIEAYSGGLFGSTYRFRFYAHSESLSREGWGPGSQKRCEN